MFAPKLELWGAVMDYLSKEYAEPILNPYLPSLLSCILDGWDSAQQLPDRHKLESGTKSGIVRDFIVDNVKEVFGSTPEVTPIQIKDYFFLRIDRFHIRFKKLDYNRLPRNYPTKQATALEKQLLELPDVNDQIYLNAGYITNEFETKVLGAYVTCQIGKVNQWEIALGGVENGFTALPTQQAFDETRIIRPKKELIGNKEVNGEPL